jgi:hypothetical protein
VVQLTGAVILDRQFAEVLRGGRNHESNMTADIPGCAT